MEPRIGAYVGDNKIAQALDSMGSEAYLYATLIAFVLYMGLWAYARHVPTLDPKDPEGWLDRRSIDEYHPAWSAPILDLRPDPQGEEKAEEELIGVS